MKTFVSSLEKRARIVGLVGALIVALAISVYYNAVAPLPPNSISGLVVHKNQVVDSDNSGDEVPIYDISIYLFNDDEINDLQATNESSYRVDQSEFDSVRINDVVKGRIVPGPFKGFTIVDIFEVIPAKDVIDETIMREYPRTDESQIIEK